MPMATNSRTPRVMATCALALALAACSDSGTAPPATPAAAAAAQDAATPVAPAPVPAAVAAKVKAMGADELREAAGKALRENRIYAPAGDNAMEYYLALRSKQPGDVTVSGAINDMLPFVVIGTEQSITKENFDEAKRLYGLVQQADPHAPALPRLGLLKC